MIGGGARFRSRGFAVGPIQQSEPSQPSNRFGSGKLSKRGKPMNRITKLATAAAFVGLAACGSHNSATNNTAEMNYATDLNTTTEYNTTTDMNATGDMNAVGNTDMNAMGNSDMNAATNNGM
jgi:hypothetical protein